MKLADFSLATKMVNKSNRIVKLYTSCGSLAYCAPETLEEDPEYYGH